MWTLYLLVAFIACALAAYMDSKTGEISNKLTYPLIIIGFLLSLYPTMFLNIVWGLIFMVVTYPFYEKKLFGGGDIKLILGLILINPLTDIIFIVIWLFIACIFALIMYAIKYFIKKERGKNVQKLRFGIPLFVAMFVMVLNYFLPYII